jgi:hypothetical protein
MRNGKSTLWQTNVKSKTNVEIVIISVEKVKMESRDFSLGDDRNVAHPSV